MRGMTCARTKTSEVPTQVRLLLNTYTVGSTIGRAQERTERRERGNDTPSFGKFVSKTRQNRTIKLIEKRVRTINLLKMVGKFPSKPAYFP